MKPIDLIGRGMLTRRGMLGGMTAAAMFPVIHAQAQTPPPAAQPAGGTGRSPAPDLRRIDVHAHYLTDRYRQAAEAAGHARPDGMPGLPRWSVQAALGMMDRFHIEAAILSVSSPGVHFGDNAAARALARSVNEEGARAVSDHPRRFGLFASLPLPDVDGALEELAYALDVLKADGVVLETNYHGVYLGDDRLHPILAELDRRGATIFIHPTSPDCPCCQDMSLGYPRPMIEFLFETTRAVTNLILRGALDRFANLRIIVPHAGATLPVVADRITGLSPALGLSRPLDTEHFFATLRGLYYDLAGFPVPRQLGALLQIADPKHLFYGSDYPFTPLPVIEKLSENLTAITLFDNSTLGDVLRENALNLFPRFRA
jgi:6-methylsalicylate decarboxylase